MSNFIAIVRNNFYAVRKINIIITISNLIIQSILNISMAYIKIQFVYKFHANNIELAHKLYFNTITNYKIFEVVWVFIFSSLIYFIKLLLKCSLNNNLKYIEVPLNYFWIGLKNGYNCSNCHFYIKFIVSYLSEWHNLTS